MKAKGAENRVETPDTERAKVSADNGLCPWYNASASHMKQAFPKRFFDTLELISLLDMKMNRQFKLETAVYGPVRTVVWEDGGKSRVS